MLHLFIDIEDGPLGVADQDGASYIDAPAAFAEARNALREVVFNNRTGNAGHIVKATVRDGSGNNLYVAAMTFTDTVAQADVTDYRRAVRSA